MNDSKNTLKTYIVIIFILFVVYLLIFLTNLNDYFLADELDFFEMQEKSPFYFLYQGFNRKYYRPLGLAFLNSIYYLFYLNPIPYHLISISLHVANSVLIYHVSKRFFKKESTSIIVLFISVVFVALYFEAVIWVASYFELFFVLFCLISIEFFLKYLESREKNKKYFLLANLFLTVGFLFKESAFFLLLCYLMYEFSQFNFFDLDNLWLHMKNFIQKILIYLTFIPLLIILFIGRFLVNLRFESTITEFLDFQTLFILAGGALVALGLYWIFVYKIKNENLKFILMPTVMFAFLLIFHLKSRIFYFPCLMGAIALGFIFDHFNYDIFSWIKEIKSIKRRKNLFSVFFIVGITLISGFFIIYHKNIYKFLSTSNYNICRTLETVPNGDQKDIFIVNLYYFGGYYFSLVDIYFEAELYLRHKQDYNITTVYINVGDTSLYRYNDRSIPLSIEEYDNLTNTTLNPNHVCFLFLPLSMNILNITNKNYSEWA